jgi:predicted dehydrogenase
MGVFQATTAAYPGYPRRLEITGSEGTIVLEHDRIVAADFRDASPDLIAEEITDRNLSASSPVVSDVCGHQRVLEDFLGAIQSNKQPRCDGQEGRRSVALVQAIYKASRRGGSHEP